MAKMLKHVKRNARQFCTVTTNTLGQLGHVRFKYTVV